MISNIDDEVKLEKSAWYYSMVFWIRYDCTEDNYLSYLLQNLQEIARKAEHIFMKKLGSERYHRIISHNKGHGPIRALFTTGENEIEVIVRLEHCGCGEK